jgi:hypothetical protein
MFRSASASRPFLPVDTDLTFGTKPHPANPNHGPIGSRRPATHGFDGASSDTVDSDPFGLKFD